jgi:RNA polymerase primary sigma factor
MKNFIEFYKVSKKLKSILKDLTPREREILSLRFGIRFDKSLTLEEVGKQFGVTRERIRQIEAKTLCKIDDELERLNEPAREN